MPRRKMTDEEKRERRERMQAKAAEEQRISNLSSDLKRLRYDFKNQTQFGPPTRSYEVGERVTYGAHKNAKVLEVSEDGFYHIRVWGMKKEQHGVVKYPYEIEHWEPWYRLEKEISLEERGDPMSYRDDVRIHHSNRCIGGLIHMHYSGLDYDPEYQRGHEWTLEQRVALIDSIFNNIDIGKFTLITRGYDYEGPYWEILDGKQRLTTLILFYEDRFTYHGKVYSKMHFNDQGHFEGYQALLAETEGREMTREQKLRYFLKLNTTGVPQDPKHVAKIKELWENVRNK